MSAANSHPLAQKAAAAWYDGQWDVAELLMRRLVREAPDLAAGHYLYACFLLAKGQWREAWPHFDRRIGLPPYTSYRTLFRQLPLWRGEAVGPEARLLLVGDMGYGDIIMCSRFLPQLASRFGAVTFVMPEGLKCLMAGQFPGVATIEVGEPMPAATHLGLTFSLMQNLDITPDSLDNRPYLKAEPTLVEQWRQRLGDGFKVGLAWSGSKLHPGDAERSLKAEQLKPLLAVPGVRLISLQFNTSPADLEGLAGIEHDPAIANATLAELAAVMENLDLVITVDSAPAHLAGALGRPVWVILQHVADWRWLPGRPDTLWYQSARLFRAPKRYDMDAAIKVMAEELAGIAQAGRQGVD